MNRERWLYFTGCLLLISLPVIVILLSMATMKMWELIYDTAERVARYANEKIRVSKRTINQPVDRP
jgi:hypothetical protein